jgi:Flp pilus assembly protein TadG
MTRRASFLRRLLTPAIARGHGFARDERGVTLIEFAILAIPFFTIITATIETAMVFFAGQILDSAVEDASRLVRTGQAQAQGFSVDDFRDYMCSYTFGLFDCSAIRIKVTGVGSFGSAQLGPAVQTCTETECTWAFDNTFAAGSRRQVIQVSAYYRWPLIFNMPYFNLRNQPDNYRLLAATRVFRNEPF